MKEMENHLLNIENPQEIFEDIRPYLDHEVRPILEQLIVNSEFLGSIARFYHPKLTNLFRTFSLKLVQLKLRRQVKGVYDVKSMQDVLSGYMDKIIHDTTTELTSSGLDNLGDGKNYLFISNHRDITMDPAFVNYMLYHAGHDTLQIAIGDNLLRRPFVADLMRLNKSFIVKRSLQGREKLKHLTILSKYIHQSIKTGQNVWIAQREGRAKDGVDRTEPALIKMLTMARRDLQIAESLRQLHIVPVAISYEFDPCDVMKAEWIYQKEQNSDTSKNEEADVKSIVTGMMGFKGRVHVAFGSEIFFKSTNADEAASEIDAQIVDNYKLWDTNELALQRIKTEFDTHQKTGLEPKLDNPISIDSVNVFEKRLQSVDPKLHKIWLYSYANPILSKLDLGSKKT